MKKISFSVLLFLFISALLYAGTNNNRPPALLGQKPVSAIILVGNKHTKAEVLRRELLFKEGDMVSDSLLRLSRKRLENLWLFNRVEMMALPQQDSVSILIAVTERLFFFPYPIFTVDDRDWNKVTYGLGFAHVNFRGRNEKLYFNMLFGHQSGYMLAYDNPWFGGKRHFTGGLFLKKYGQLNRSLPFKEKHLYAAGSFGKYWSRFFSSQLVLYVDHIRVDAAWQKYMSSGRTQENNIGLRLISKYDTRDLYAYPSHGWFVNTMLIKSGFFEPKIDYYKYSLDVRHYDSYKGLILAGRVFLRRSMGDLPIYDRVYFGFGERIRGHFYEVYEGRHALSGGLALRFPLLKTRYFDLPSYLLPESSMHNLKFGINGGLFAESGVVWEKPAEFALPNFISGFGLGLHFLLPYIEVLRMDLAFNEKLQSQLLVEILMPF